MTEENEMSGKFKNEKNVENVKNAYKSLINRRNFIQKTEPIILTELKNLGIKNINSITSNIGKTKLNEISKQITQNHKKIIQNMVKILNKNPPDLKFEGHNTADILSWIKQVNENKMTPREFENKLKSKQSSEPPSPLNWIRSRNLKPKGIIKQYNNLKLIFQQVYSDSEKVTQNINSLNTILTEIRNQELDLESEKKKIDDEIEKNIKKYQRNNGTYKWRQWGTIGHEERIESKKKLNEEFFEAFSLYLQEKRKTVIGYESQFNIQSLKNESENKTRSMEQSKIGMIQMNTMNDINESTTSGIIKTNHSNDVSKKNKYIFLIIDFKIFNKKEKEAFKEQWTKEKIKNYEKTQYLKSIENWSLYQHTTYIKKVDISFHGPLVTMEKLKQLSKKEGSIELIEMVEKSLNNLKSTSNAKGLMSSVNNQNKYMTLHAMNKIREQNNHHGPYIDNILLYLQNKTQPSYKNKLLVTNLLEIIKEKKKFQSIAKLKEYHELLQKFELNFNMAKAHANLESQIIKRKKSKKTKSKKTKSNNNSNNSNNSNRQSNLINALKQVKTSLRNSRRTSMMDNNARGPNNSGSPLESVTLNTNEITELCKKIFDDKQFNDKISIILNPKYEKVFLKKSLMYNSKLTKIYGLQRFYDDTFTPSDLENFLKVLKALDLKTTETIKKGLGKNKLPIHNRIIIHIVTYSDTFFKDFKM